MALFSLAATADKKMLEGVGASRGGGHLKTMLLVAALFLAGCAVNVRQNGRCPTPGVSPFASNCPTAEDRESH